MAKKSTAGLIRLSPDQIKDIDEGLAILDGLAVDLEKARECGTPGVGECAAQREEIMRRLAAYKKNFGPVTEESLANRRG